MAQIWQDFDYEQITERKMGICNENMLVYMA